MKKLCIVLALVAIANVAFALTAQEEIDIKNMLKDKAKLSNLVTRESTLSAVADNINLENLPLEIAVLKKERENLISARDGELNDATIAFNATRAGILSSYSTSIQNKEAEISALQSQLESLVP